MVGCLTAGAEGKPAGGALADPQAVPVLRDLGGVLALDLRAPDGVRHRADGGVQEVRVVPRKLCVARQTPQQQGVQLLGDHS